MDPLSDVLLRSNDGSDKFKPLRFTPGTFASSKFTLILTFALGKLTFFFNSTTEVDSYGSIESYFPSNSSSS